MRPLPHRIPAALLVALLLASCTGPMAGRVPAPADFILERRLERAERLLEEGEIDDAARLYDQLANDYEPHRHSAWARMRLAEIALTEGDTAEAESLLREVRRELPEPAPGQRPDPAYARTELLMGRLLFQQRKWREARGALEAYLSENPGSPDSAKVLLMIGQIHEKRGETRFALRAYDRGIDSATDPGDVGRLRERVRTLLAGLEAPDLEDLTTLYRGRYVGQEAQLALVNLARAGQATGETVGMLGAYPTDTGLLDNQLFAERFRGIEPADPGTVGVLLPLSGPYAAYGRLALAGIMSAAGVFEPASGKRLRFVVRDTAGDPGRVPALIEELVREHDAIGVVGPMVGEVVERAALEANRIGLPLITLTRKSPLSGLGEFVFRSSLTDEILTDYLVRLSHDEVGIQRYAVLYPDDAYGIGMRDLFIRTVRASGGDVVAMAKYEPGAVDFGDPIRSLIHAQRQSVQREGDELRVGFDALFLPASTDTLELIAPQLAYYDLTAVQLLGTSAFNSQPLLQEAGDFLQGALFVDGFLPSSQDPRTRAFVDRYFLDFQQNPGLVEALAFEAANVLEDLLIGGELRTPLDLARALLTLDGYQGVAGLTGFDPSGEARRDLKVLTVAGRQVVALGWPTTEWDERAAVGASPSAVPSFESVPLSP